MDCQAGRPDLESRQFGEWESSAHDLPFGSLSVHLERPRSPRTNAALSERRPVQLRTLRSTIRPASDAALRGIARAPLLELLSKLLSADLQGGLTSARPIEESDRCEYENLVPRAGVEPARGCPQRFLRPPRRLPFRSRIAPTAVSVAVRISRGRELLQHLVAYALHHHRIWCPRKDSNLRHAV